MSYHHSYDLGLYLLLNPETKKRHREILRTWFQIHARLQKEIHQSYSKRNRNRISVILDDTLTDQKIMDLVAIGYEKTKK